MGSVPEQRASPATQDRGIHWPWRRMKLNLSPRAREEIAAYLLISPWIIKFVILTAGAMIASLVMSFFKTDMLSTSRFVGLRNYSSILFSDKLARRALVNTAYYSLTTVPLRTAFALSIALLLNQGVKGQGFFRTVYYLPSVVSGVAVSIIWAWLFNPDLGLINALLADR